MVKAVPKELFTVGHSTHSFPEFLDIITFHHISRIIDVRTVPRSRHNPQFNKETFPETLAKSGLDYFHLPGLGGLRTPHKDSLNTQWRNPSFRGYADYMQTDSFKKNLEELIELATKRRSAIMCAESLPWRCHRWLIADALAVRGMAVLHVMGKNSVKPHELTPFARVNELQLSYP